MNRFLNWFSGIFAVVFLIPSFLVMVSWNAIPGDFTYGVKTGLEDVLLAFVSNTSFAPRVSAAYTERRFTEATKLLDEKGSTVGYTLLVAEAKQTQDFIIENNDSKSAQELIQKIEQYEREIETKKIAIQQGRTSIPVASRTADTSTGSKSSPSQPAAVNQPLPAPQPIVKTPPPDIKPSKVEVVVATSEQEVIEDLEEVQEELEEIREEIERNMPQGFLEHGGGGGQDNDRENSRGRSSDNENNRDENGRGRDDD